jgi:hypothetical protein
MIYSATAKGPFKVPGVYDKDSKRIISIRYKPEVWSPGMIYYSRSETEFDIVRPYDFFGLYFKCTATGRSGGIEPTWPQIEGGSVTDGCVFEAMTYDMLDPDIDIVASTFTASDGVELEVDTFTASNASVMIAAVPAGLTSFTVTNHTTKTSGEEDNVTLLFKVAER